MCKKMWQSFLSVTVAIAIIVTSFLRPVYAETKTLDDLYNRLTNIYQALNGVSTSRPETVTYKVNELKRDIEWLFGAYGSGAGEGHISYVYNNQSYTNMPINYALGDMISQQNEILMSIVSSYVDASDPDNPVVRPGLFAKVDNLASLIASGNGTDVQIEADLDGVLSDLNSIKSYMQTIISLNEQSFYDLESFTAYHLFAKQGWDGTFDITTFNYPALDITTIPATDYSGSYNAYKRISVKSGDTVLISFYSNMYLLQASNGVSLNSGNNRSIYWHSSSGSSDIEAKLIDYQTERVTNSGYLYHLFFTNNSSTTQFISFDILMNGPTTIYIIPFYAGSTRFLSDHMKSVIQYDNDILLKDLQETNETWFQRIYNHLIGDPDSSNKTQQDIDSMNDKVSDIQDSLDNYSGQLDQNIDQVNPSGLLTNVQQQGQKVNFLSGIIQQVFTSFGSYSWLFLLPLVFGLILLFMG